MMLVGNGIYLCVQLLPSDRKYLVLVSRFIVGIGSSNISLLRAYASTASTPTERSRAIAYVIGGNALGMSIGPALQLLASPIGYPGLVVAGTFSLSMYTVPAVMASCMNVIGMLAVYFVFKESYAGVVDKKDNSCASTESEELPKCDQWAVVLCNFSRFVHKLVSANTETLSAPLAMAVFAFTKTDVLQYVSVAQALRSLAGFGVYVVYAILNVEKRFARFDFRLNCLVSLVGIVLFYLLTFPWPFLPGHLQTFSSSTSNATVENISGCDVDSFTWCETLRPVNVYLYYVSYVLFIGIFYPNFNISFSTLFSRILGPKRQGTQQGILQVSEGSATMAGPVFISALYTAYGPQAAWMLQIATLSSVFALWIASYNRLVPREQRRVTKKEVPK
ncbi:Protein F27D9.2 [Aphelenchoides avenae]|nr:Protein F27D9.2 [Aphelenchus avenae]